MAEEAKALPQVGETLHGFTVTELGMERVIDTPTVMFTHDKTGALVRYIASDDIDCSFDISFQTPKLDSKGIPHVFEHITISGSEKYPAQNLFFPLIGQTYNTFANAMTYPTMTTYPSASMSEDQLLLLADYYLDGLFHPMVYSDERYAQREAWRYELTSADAPLTLTGTVYNEMRGNESIQADASYNMLGMLFPDSILSTVNGGDPDHIPEITWQDLLDFHDAYYHPSNSLTVLYGNMDVERFLALLDGYFSAYDAKEIDVPTGEVDPIAAYEQTVFEFPVEKDSPAANASVLYYGFVADDMGLEDSIGLSMLSYLLSHESGPLKQAIRGVLPQAVFYASVDTTVPDPYIVFALEGANADDAEIFKETVDQTLAQIAEDGIDKDLIDAVIAEQEFSLLLVPETSMLGVNLSVTTAQMWAAKGTTEYMNVNLDAFEMIKREAPNGYFEGMLKTYILENPHSAMAITVPAPGLAEENAAALADRLAEVKAQMSEEEIQALIADGQALDAWSKEEAPKALIESLQAVTASTLPEEYKTYELTEGDIGGVRTMTAQASVGDIGRTILYLDTQDIPQDLLHAYRLYVAMLGMVDTESHTRQELQTLLTRYMYGFGGQATALWNMDKSWRPTMLVSWMSLNDDYETSLALAREVLFTSRMDDLSMLKTVISQERLTMRDSLNNSAYSIQATRAGAQVHPDMAYTSYLNGLDYYTYLSEADQQLTDDPDALVESLHAVQALLANKEGAVVLYAGNESGLEAFEGSLDALFAGIEAAPREEAALSLPIPAHTEALVVDSTVQYNMLYASLEELGLEYTAKMTPLSSMIYDAYLTPQIRHGIGAYDNIASMSQRGFTFCSYRDPSITETFAVYDGLADFVREAAFTQEDVDRFILGSYSSYVQPQGDLTGAVDAMTIRLTGWPDDIRLTRMQEIKSTTVEDLHALAGAFEALSADGIRSTSGGAAMIESNADLYEEIIYAVKESE